MAGHVCPPWVGYLLISPMRRLWHDPKKILGPYVKEGMTVLDLGCAMGFFTLEMAKIVGERGRVIAIDVQEKMIEVLMRRARRHGVANRIHATRCGPERFEVPFPVDFALSFAVAHEVSDPEGFFAQVRASLKPEGRVLLVEPKWHVSKESFEALVRDALAAGLKRADEPAVSVGRSALFCLG